MYFFSDRTNGYRSYLLDVYALYIEVDISIIFVLFVLVLFLLFVSSLVLFNYVFGEALHAVAPVSCVRSRVSATELRLVLASAVPNVFVFYSVRIVGRIVYSYSAE